MIPIVTSFSPNPKDDGGSLACYRSWKAQGFDVHAVQGPGEEVPGGLGYGVQVSHVKQPGPPRIVCLLQKAADLGGAIIMNSDLAMPSGPFSAIDPLLKATLQLNVINATGCIWLRRWNVDCDGRLDREKYGIDAFVLNPPPALLEFFEPLDLRIGQPGWDYVLPYWFLMRGLPLWTIDEPPLLLHQEHPIRWSQAAWEQNALIGAQALGIAPTVQLRSMLQLLNLDIDRYSKRLALSSVVDAPG